MKSTSFLYALSLSLATLAVVEGSCSNSKSLKKHSKGPRRHSHKAKSSSVSVKATPVALAAQRAPSAVSTASSTAPVVAPPAGMGRNNKQLYLPAYGTITNGIHVGFLPDDGSGGGQPHSMAEINSQLGKVSSAYGYYAQAQSGTIFDGQQLLYRLDDIKAAGGVFQPAVMPTGGWEGLKYNDNRQAVAIAKVMQKFVDEGLEVWLRFAHEVNYYQEDGTYQGGVSDFKEGWAVVAAAIKEHAPAVKMWFTPNVANLAQYDEYYPDDPTTVDLIGIDYYPQDINALNFIAAMKPFHDKYTSETTKFAVGETGLASESDMGTRLRWLTQATSVETAASMKHYIAVSWFNYQKGYNFKIMLTSGDSAVKAYLS